MVTSTSEYPLDEWLATVRECKYLPENDLKKLCDLVSIDQNLLLETPPSIFTLFTIRSFIFKKLRFWETKGSY